MQILGNILLSLALLVYLLPVQLLLAATRRAHSADGGAIWGALLAFGPLWLLLIAGLLIATARGGFDWIPLRRGGLHLLMVLAGMAMLVTTLFAFVGRVESASQLPLVSRLFLGWADLVLPLATGLALLFALNPGWGAGFPPMLQRLPFALLAGASLVHGLALLGEWSVRAQQREQTQIREQLEFQARFDRERLARVTTLDPQRDFSELLGESAAHDPQIRAIARNKLLQHPDFLPALVVELGSWRAEAALDYLTAHPVAEADKPLLAEPVQAALAHFARRTAAETDGQSGFDPVGFARRARMVPTIAQQFVVHQPALVNTVREFRAEIRRLAAVPVPPEVLADLDRWLAAYAPT